MSEQRTRSDLSMDIDIFGREYTEDPAPVWTEMQQRCPVAHTEHWGGLWISSKYDHARDLAMMTSTLSNRQVSVVPMPEERDLLADYNSHLFPPISNDPPEHTPLRRLILPFFSPKAVQAHIPFTEDLCNRLIDGFIEDGKCDAAADYAQQITPRVIAHMLSIDTERADDFVSWVRGFIELGATDVALRASSRREIRAYFGELIEQRRANPGDDYISQLLSKEVDGEPLTDNAVMNFCLLLLIAGVDTTWSSLGSSMLHFATHPEHRQRMVNEPELFPSAVEELLRFYSPVSVGRIAMEDVQFGDAVIKRGERLMINYPAGNRDPEAFDRPDEVVLDRKKNRHFAFGVGVHRCAGSNLARMEMEVALRTWFARIPQFELTDPEQVTWAPGQVRGARSVPVRFSKPSRAV